MVTTAGCATTGLRPADSGARSGVDGPYEGAVTVGDQQFPSTLSLETGRDGRVTGMLRVASPIDIDGEVRGVVIDDLLRITVTYDADAGCDGTVEGILDVGRRGAFLEGPVTIDDCGVPVAGRMTFRRATGGQ